MSATQAMVPADRTIPALEAAFTKAKPELEKVLPRHLTAERLWRIAISTVSRTPRLQECTTISIIRSVMQAAQLGLEPGTPLGLSYLVPFWNNKVNSYECQLVPGYRGLIHLALEGGHVADVEAHVVYEGEFFKWESGLNPVLRHRPELTDGDVIAVYAIATLKSGIKKFEVMRRSQIDAIRKRSQQPDGAWATDYAEMARKTVVKRLSKYLKLTRQLAAAIELDNRAESGERNNVIDIFGEEMVEAPPIMRAPPLPSLPAAADGPRQDLNARSSSTPPPAAPKASAAPPAPLVTASTAQPAQVASPAEAPPRTERPEDRSPPPSRVQASPAPGDPPAQKGRRADWTMDADTFISTPNAPGPAAEKPTCGRKNGKLTVTLDGKEAWVSCVLAPEHDGPHSFEGMSPLTGASDDEDSGSQALADDLAARIAPCDTPAALEEVRLVIKTYVDHGGLLTTKQKAYLQARFLEKKRALKAATAPATQTP